MQRYLVVAALVVVVACTLVHAERAERRRNEGRPRRVKPSGQAQACKWDFGPCQLTSSSATCGEGVKIGTSQNQNCSVPEKRLKCKISCGCKYKPVRDSTSTGCDRETKKKEVKQELVSGDPLNCPKTKSVYKKCRVPSANHKNSRGSREVRPGNKRNGEGRAERKKATTAVPDVDVEVAPAGGKGCKYKKGGKTECDPLTNKKTITLELKKKSPASCPATKTIKKDCKVKVKGDRPKRRGSNFF